MSDDIFRSLRDLPFRRFALAQLNRAQDVVERLGVPAMSDQYAGKNEPAAFSCWYGPIPMQATRHVGSIGFDALAPLVTPSTPYLPRDTNPLTGADRSFMLMDWNTSAYLQWGYKQDPGFAAPIDPAPLGDIFDPVLGANGGGQLLQNFSDAFVNKPRVCFEIDLYDKKRGRSMTNGRIPGQVALGGHYEFKRQFGPMRWDPDTEVEPRVFITEMKTTSALSTTQAYEAAQVAVYLNLVFRGFHSFTQHPSGAEY